jgi:crotonobetainyl-CoA:carnitine CoA-transferase CaiB-like acyl-CoA transferase
MAGPLDGVRVFDWTIWGVGPGGTSVLGQLGADVIKVESPDKDPMYFGTPAINGVSSLYMSFNRNKRSVTLDLKQPTDRDLALKLIATCDLFVTNMRQGVPERLGLGYEVVRAVRPDIIYARASGWGSKGPMAQRGSVDPRIQVASGWTSINGKPGGRGELLRYLGQLDINTGLHLAAACLEALVARDRTGHGQVVDTSMLGAAIAIQTSRIAEFLAAGQSPPRTGSAAMTTAPHEAFECLDKEYLAVGVVTDGQWRRLCDALETPDLADDSRFTTNQFRVERRAELSEVLAKILGSKPSAWWVRQLTRHRVPHGRFWNFETMRYHPMVLENEDIVRIDTARCGEIAVGGPTCQFSESPVAIQRSPFPGEHTDEILGHLTEATVPKLEPGPHAVKGDGPLAGLRVLEIAEGISGPYCGQLLGDAGADVIKIEPAAGDQARAWGPPFVGGESAVFVALNRNKRSVVLDLRDSVFAARLEDLVRWADVVIVDRIDADGLETPIGYEGAKTLNPKAVYCCISPFGEKGPFANMPGSELVFQAQSNICAGLGSIGEPPTRLGTDKASMNAGLFAYHGVLAALHWRARFEKGQKVSVSQQGSFIAVNSHHWAALSDMDTWAGVNLTHWTDPPEYGYRTKDVPVMIVLGGLGAAATDDDLPGILEDLGIKDLPWRLKIGPRGAMRPAEPASGDNKPEIAPTAPEMRAIWEEAFQNLTADELDKLFNRHNGEVIPFNTYSTLMSWEQTAHLGIFHELRHPSAGTITVTGTPWTLSVTPEDITRRPPPRLGEHTDEVLSTSLA